MIDMEQAMQVIVDETFERSVGDMYGQYVGTLRQAAVRVDLFERGEQLVAHVSDLRLPDGVLGELNRIAADRGFDGHLRLVFSYPRP